MEKKKYMVTQSSMPEFDEYINEIKSIWDTKWLTNMGEKHNRLQDNLKSYLDVKEVTLFSNGHLALENAIRILQLKGDVITTPFTFASTTHAIVQNGLTPVFCDINLENCTIDVNKIEALITEKTCAIIPVHVYGHLCDVEKIEEIAKKYGLKVIYDAAHAFGEKYKGRGVANFGDMSMFSFHATKVFNTIEGGAIAYNDASYKHDLYNIKNFGIENQDSVTSVGGNAKMNEFQAAMGLCNLKSVNKSIGKRKLAHNQYIKNLGDCDGIVLFNEQKDVDSNYSYFPVLVNSPNMTRDELKSILEEKGIFTRKYFFPLISDFECYCDKYNSKDTPNAKYAADRVLTLPLYENLEVDDVNYICDVIKSVLR